MNVECLYDLILSVYVFASVEITSFVIVVILVVLILVVTSARFSIVNFLFSEFDVVAAFMPVFFVVKDVLDWSAEAGGDEAGECSG